MFKLEDVDDGVRWNGVVSAAICVVSYVVWNGSNDLIVVYKSDSGRFNERLFYCGDERSPSVRLLERSRRRLSDVKQNL